MIITSRISWLCALATVLQLAGCQSSVPPKVTQMSPGPAGMEVATAVPAGNGLELLKKGMDRYKNAKSFTAECAWSMQAGTGPNSVTRSNRRLYFEAPNKFHASSKMPDGFKQDSVSDGVSTLEWSNGNGPETTVMKYDAPVTIDKVASMQMLHPMFNGSLIYEFFSGSNGVESLVNPAKGAITKGKPVMREGEQAFPIKFYARRQFGHTTALIGEKTGKVYEITYDAEPLVELLKRAKPQEAANLKDLETKEVYSHIEFDNPIAKDLLFAKPPAGSKIMDAPQPGETPVGPKVGTKAPEFTCATMDGSPPLKLSSLKGQYVLIDFWATWCGPCKVGLPHTEALYKSFQGKNVKVMAVSDEEIDTIKDFWKKNGYTMPVYQDTGHQASKDYDIEAIPAIVLIDPQGKIAYSQLGLRPEEELMANLAKAGLK